MRDMTSGAAAGLGRVTGAVGAFKSLLGRTISPAPPAPPKPVLAHVARPHLIVMSIIFAGAAAIGYVILPGENERIAALERDGQTRRALAMLEARFGRGDRSPRTLSELQRFYERSGDTDKSRTVLEQLAALRPRDPLVQRQLAGLYKSTHDEAAYVKALQAQLALRFSQPVCKELIGIHRRQSNYEAEQAMINECSNRGYRVPEDMIRLAFLEATDGKMARAAQILRAVDDRRWLKDARDRFLLFDALIDTEQANEAVRRAVRWLKGQPNEDVAIDLVYKLVEGGKNDLAMQMARDIGQPGDGVSLSVGEIMVDQVQYSLARLYLAGWLEQAKAMNLEVATRFVTAALDAEDPLLGLKGAEKFGLAKLGQPELVQLGEVLSASGRWAELDRVRGAVHAETVASNYLLAAAFELRGGRAEMARAYLSRVKIEELDERRSGYFSRLAEQAGRGPGLSAVLREPPKEVRQSPTIGAAPAARRAVVVGPKQALEKQRILKRAETNKQAREKARAEKKAAPASASSSGPLFPFLFPGAGTSSN